TQLEGGGVRFVRALARGVRRQRTTQTVLGLRVVRGVAIYCARRRVDEALHSGIFGRDQHLYEAVDVDCIRTQRVVKRPGNGAQSSVVENIVRTLARGAARLQIANVTLDHTKARAAGERAGYDLVEIRAMPGREVVDADNGLAERDQLLKQI